jgi:hypothetical protein
MLRRDNWFEKPRHPRVIFNTGTAEAPHFLTDFPPGASCNSDKTVRHLNPAPAVDPL